MIRVIQSHLTGLRRNCTMYTMICSIFYFYFLLSLFHNITFCQEIFKKEYRLFCPKLVLKTKIINDKSLQSVCNNKNETALFENFIIYILAK